MGAIEAFEGSQKKKCKKKRLCGPTIQRDLEEKLVIGESFNFIHRREVMRGGWSKAVHRLVQVGFMLNSGSTR